jgi:hypothetical protein
MYDFNDFTINISQKGSFLHFSVDSPLPYLFRTKQLRYFLAHKP